MPSKKANQQSETDKAPQSSDDSASKPVRRTKQALLVELISREGGATLEELTSATGWLPHTTRAAITGLRKRGQHVERQRVDGISRYMLGRGDK